MIQKFYKNLPEKINAARDLLNKPLTLTEKILYSHLWNDMCEYNRGVDYVEFKPDRVAMQDATAQMALLQFMQVGRSETAVPSTVHCDHLIRAKVGASDDLKAANFENSAVYNFLKSVCQKYSLGFS